MFALTANPASQQRSKARGFSLIELLIVVAIILIIAAIAIPNFMRSRMAANEAAAVSSLKNITTAQHAYFATYNMGFADTLTKLAPPAGGGLVSEDNAGLIDEVLAGGAKSGYAFVLTAGDVDSFGRLVSFDLNANPVTPGATGQRFFYTNLTGVIRFNNADPATESDLPIG